MAPNEVLGVNTRSAWFVPKGRKGKYKATPLTRAIIAGGMIVLVCLMAVAIPGIDRRRLSIRHDEASIVDCENDLDQIPGLAVTVYVILLLFGFIGLAVITDDFFVPSLTVISARLKLTEDVAGATLMASGSSAPELFTSLVDAFHNSTSIGIGTIVGSAVFNILVIIACSGAWATDSLIIDWKPFSRDCVFYSLSIILLVILIYWDGKEIGEVYWWEGLIMFLCYGFYVLIMIYNGNLMRFLGSCAGEIQETEADKAFKKELVPLRHDETVVISFDPKCRNDLVGDVYRVFNMKAQGMVGVQKIWYDEEQGTFHVVSDKSQVIKDELHGLAAQAYNEVCGLNGNACDSILGISEEPRAAGIAGGGGPEEPKDMDNQRCCLLRYIEIVIMGIANVWTFFYSLHIPDVNSEDMRDELQSNGKNDELLKDIEKKERGYVFAFGLSILWIACICFSMVWFAERIGCLIGIRPLFMGLTVIAAGTSIPDALGSIASAKRGMGDMAVANAIGSNVFDILIGLGLPWFLRGIYMNEPFMVEVDDLLVFIGILFFTIFLTLGSFLITKWKLGPTVGKILLSLYIAFLIFAFLYVYIFA